MMLNSVMVHDLLAVDAQSAAMSVNMMSSPTPHDPSPCDGRMSRFKTSSTSYDPFSNTFAPDLRWSPWRSIEESALPMILWT